MESDDDVRALALDEDRLLVTRDRQLAARTPDSIPLTPKDTDAQLRELHEAGVPLELDPGARCGACNGPLDELPADADRSDYVPDDADPVWRCRDCGQCFWRGSHWTDVAERLP